jgi:hypothetical protein
VFFTMSRTAAPSTMPISRTIDTEVFASMLSGSFNLRIAAMHINGKKKGGESVEFAALLGHQALAAGVLA